MTPDAGRRSRIAWGLPDALLCWIAGFVGATFAGFPFASEKGRISTVLLFGVVLPVQQFATVLAIVFVTRLKGQGSLTRDFGFRVRLADAKLLVVGVGLELGLTLVLVPIFQLDPDAKNQQLIQDFTDHRTFGTIVLFFIGAVVLAPVMEELLFRGLLLRALLRRVSPETAVLSSSLLFALVHYLGDPSALPLLPALTGLGAFLAVLAMRTGDLSASIFVHAGFNLTTMALILFLR